MRIDIINKIRKNYIINNMFILLCGDGVVSIISFINMAIIIRTIGLNSNGIILMVQTYCMLFNDMLNFQSFNAVIKFFPSALERNENIQAKNYLKFALTLDLSTATLAIIIGNLALPFVANFMNWNTNMMLYIRIYMIIVIFNATGTFTACIRIYNKFKFITYSNVLASFVKLILYVIGFAVHGNILYFLICEMTLEIIRNCSLIIFGYNVLKQNAMNDFIWSKLKWDKEFFSFNIYNNLSVSVGMLDGYYTSFILNKMLGFKELAVYKIFEKIAALITKINQPLGQIIYPEMSKMIAKNKFYEARRLAFKLLKLIVAGGIVTTFTFFITHKLWLGILIKDYNLYIYSIVLYLLIETISQSCVGIHNLFTAAGYIKYNLIILLCANGVYVFMLYFMATNYGLFGVVLAHGLQVFMVVCPKILMISRIQGRELNV